jgi:hypothetical protein
VNNSLDKRYVFRGQGQAQPKLLCKGWPKNYRLRKARKSQFRNAAGYFNAIFIY